MRKDRIEATNVLASQLFAAEAAIDTAIAEIAKLSSMMPEARIQAKVSACVGHDALQHASNSLLSLVEARTEIVSVHSALDQAKTDIGLRTYGLGGGWQKGPSAVASLEIVSDAA